LSARSRSALDATHTHDDKSESTPQEDEMPQGSKAKYTAKQRRKAEHIEEGYKKDGVPAKEAAARAWATVNKQDGGAQGGGSATKRGKPPSKKARSDSAKKAAATRRRNKAKAQRKPKRSTRAGTKKKASRSKKS
jgi:hypothetical protein